jgi:hypothetical protein
LTTRNRHRYKRAQGNTESDDGNCRTTAIAPSDVAACEQNRRNKYVSNSAVLAPFNQMFVVRVDDASVRQPN